MNISKGDRYVLRDCYDAIYNGAEVEVDKIDAYVEGRVWVKLLDRPTTLAVDVKCLGAVPQPKSPAEIQQELTELYLSLIGMPQHQLADFIWELARDRAVPTLENVDAFVAKRLGKFYLN